MRFRPGHSPCSFLERDVEPRRSPDRPRRPLAAGARHRLRRLHGARSRQRRGAAGRTDGVAAIRSATPRSRAPSHGPLTPCLVRARRHAARREPSRTAGSGSVRAPSSCWPYQLEPALAVFRHGATRVLIGDDVGLGKTVEAGVIVREVMGRSATARALVIVPAALRRSGSRSWRRCSSSGRSTPTRHGCERSRVSCPRTSTPGRFPASTCLDRLREAAGSAQPAEVGAVGSAGHRRGPWRNAGDRQAGCRRRARLPSVDGGPAAVGHTALRQTRINSMRSAALAAARAVRRSSASGDRAPTWTWRSSPLRSRVMHGALRPTPSARCTGSSNATRRCCGRRRAAREANPALLATIFRKRALSSAGALALSLRATARIDDIACRT